MIARIGLAVLLTVLVGSAASAAGPKQTASALINEGNALMRDGDFRAALARYKAAHEVYPTPKIFFNMGEASREVGDLVEAATYFERFLAESGVKKRSKLRRAARRRLKALEKKISTLSISSQAVGAKVFIDGRAIGIAPIKELRLPPGPHEVILDKPGHQTGKYTIELEPGAPHTIDEALEPVAIEPPPPNVAPPPPPPLAPPTITTTVPKEDDEGSGWWIWATLGVVVAAGAATAVVVASSASDDFMLMGGAGVSSTNDWEKL